MSTRLTDSDIRSFKPKTREYSRRDPSNPGLAIRIHPSGTKTWVYLYDHNKHRRKLTLGHYPGVSLREARARYRKAVSLREEGKDPVREKAVENATLRSTPSVEELAELYVERYAQLHKKTWHEDRRILKRDILPCWKGLLVTDLRRRDVADLLDSMAARGAPFSANAAQVVLSSMFNYAVEMEYLPANPASGLSKRGRYRPRERELSDHEISLFFQALRTAGEPRFKTVLYHLQLLTATRPGEIRCAQWSEFDLGEGTWALPGARTKNQRGHVLPLPQAAIEILRGLEHDHQKWMFPSPIKDGPLGKYNQSATIRRLFERGLLEVAPFTPHDLRRTAATQMARLGVERMIISKILNHADEHQTATYDRYTYMNEKREALEVWGQHLAGLTNPPSKIVELKRVG